MEKRVKINWQIRAKEVRLIGADGTQLGITPLEEALKTAEAEGLDLVEISPTAQPPVCRVMDYGKFKYEQSKKIQLAKKKQVVTQVKEVKFRPKTDEHDYQFKLRHIRRFLEDKDKVKVSVRFRGREIAFSGQAVNILNRIRAEIEDIGKIEYEPKMEGRDMVMIVAPKT
ncbi:MAG: translation initiation factor IF-3 [Deltaproteobacteria bacterium]|nr:translation initiation factor IF-3 [Deltaproteobacteria bacterium]MDP3029616.1 translation initiation factor IF-3 [Deltaproteobacteria bacterium]